MVRFFRSGVLLYVAAKNPDVQKQQEQKRCRLRFHASASHGLGLAITMARPVTKCDAAVITQMFWIASLTSSIRDPDSVGSLIDDGGREGSFVLRRSRIFNLYSGTMYVFHVRTMVSNN